MSQEISFDISIYCEWESNTQEIRGARSSLGVPEEPDEIVGNVTYGPLMLDEEELADGFTEDLEDGNPDGYEEQIREKIVRILKEHWED